MRMSEQYIKIWEFYDAPETFRALSEHGGDEDWLAFVPEGRCEPYWLEPDSGSWFGCCSISRHIVDGGAVYIGAHA